MGAQTLKLRAISAATADDLQRQIAELKTALGRLLPAAEALQARTASIRENARRATAAHRRYTADDLARWKALRALPELSKHSKRTAAVLIARREGLPDGAAETIRRSI